MQPIPLDQMDISINRARGLVWTRCRVGYQASADNHTWVTDWKWCIAVFDDRNRYPYPGKDPRDPRSWYIIGIHDQNGMNITEVEITHFHTLPESMGPER